MSVAPEEGTARSTSTAPAQAGLVLVALILVAAVANLNLAVANVALPDIGAAFQSSQTTLNLIAVGYSLGLACSVLYFGALGDRYGRKAMLVIGTALAIPMSLLAAWAPTDIVLFIARVGGGLAAGMAFPTTLALITALWSGPERTKSIALWHMFINLLAVTTFAGDFWLRTKRAPGDNLPIILSVIGIILITISGWLGGELVYVRGVAVREPPDQSI